MKEFQVVQEIINILLQGRGVYTQKNPVPNLIFKQCGSCIYTEPYIDLPVPILYKQLNTFRKSKLKSNSNSMLNLNSDFKIKFTFTFIFHMKLKFEIKTQAGIII